MMRRESQDGAFVRAIGRYLLTLVGGAVLLTLSLGVSHAKPQHGQKFQDWSVNCTKSPQNDAVEVCSIVQVAVDNNTNRPVMQMNVGYAGEPKIPIAIITVPLAVRLPPGMSMQIDDGKSVTVPYEVCNPDGCQARFRVDETLMSAFRAGIGGKITVVSRQGKQLSVPFSLKGFTAALTTLQ